MVRHYFPIHDENFEKSTCEKKEFKNYTWSKENKIIKSQLFPHQAWLANYIGTKTPYKGILVYHETGTGKTCTAVSIAENFREELSEKNKKITILSSEKITNEFYKTIANLDPDSVKCTGNTYNDMINGEITEDSLHKKINEYYNFVTYHNFGSSIMKGIEKEKKTKVIEKYIKEKFSNELIIIDEAQNIRDKDVTNDDFKAVHKAIDLISIYAENVRIVFLTATPMYDNPTEIIWMINILIRVNKDTCPELKASKIFDEKNGYSFKNIAAKNDFIRALRGKVSFLRGGNPERFPIKLYNKLNDNLPIKDFPNNNEVIKAIKDLDTHLTLSEMSLEHYKEIEKERDIKFLKNETDSFHMQMIQRHNVRWYKKGNSSKKGQKLDSQVCVTSCKDCAGLSSLFNISSGYTFTPKDEKLKIFEKLEDYAPKVSRIVKEIEQMKDGIAFIFSRFVDSGIIPMILALEYHGYSKYNGTKDGYNHLIGVNKSSIKGKYIAITSYRELSGSESNITQFLNVARKKGNENGEKIKVIIVSGCGSEGLDLKWIRQVHIMEPHFHFSQIEQAIGRAIRNDSHKELEKMKRNCTIYFHATKYPKGVDRETIDMYLYRKAMLKRNATRSVRKIIQENSITCEFFKEANDFSYDSFIGDEMIDSKGNKFNFTKEMVVDEGYSQKCFTCQDNNDTDIETYDPSLHSRWNVYACVTNIEQLFETADKYSLKDIKSQCKKISNKFDDETIYYALEVVVNTERVVKNIFGIEGTIIKDNEYYKFLPEHSIYTGYLSGLPLNLSNSQVNLELIKLSERPTKNIDSSDIVNKLNKLSSKTIFNYEDWNRYSQYKNDILAEILIDKMSSSDRLVLFKVMPIENASLNKALERYSLDEGYLDIKDIGDSPDIKIINKDDLTILNDITNKVKIKNIRKRNQIVFIDIRDDKSITKIMDSKENPNGLVISSGMNKKKQQEMINLISNMSPSEKIPPFMDYPRYTTNPEKPGQLPISVTKKTDAIISKDDISLELEFIFRLYEKLRNKDDMKWFFESWETYEYGLTQKKHKKKTVLKKVKK